MNTMVKDLIDQLEFKSMNHMLVLCIKRAITFKHMVGNWMKCYIPKSCPELFKNLQRTVIYIYYILYIHIKLIETSI